MSAWQADRLGLGLWVIICNDGTRHLGLYGLDGPTLGEGNKVCAPHGGIVRTTHNGPINYRVVLGPPERLSVTVGALVNAGAVDSPSAARLTNSNEPEVWANTKAGVEPLTGDPPANAVIVKATPVNLPEATAFPWRWIGAAVAVLLALAFALWRRTDPHKPGAV